MALSRADGELVRIVDAAMAEAVRRGEPGWVVCRPGCTECCRGPFLIWTHDALRLRAGRDELAAREPQRAAALGRRCHDYAAAIEELFGGGRRQVDSFDDLPEDDRWDDLPCPVLNPATGTCELYDHRPLACRTFGAATRVDNQEDGAEAIAACELCYVGVAEQQVAACAVEVDPDRLEAALIEDTGARLTLVAFALDDGAN